MSLLLLARHGNTFGPGDTPVWVGAKEDLPLVESGEAQARALGEALAQSGFNLARLISGPLRRTRRAAEIVQALTGFAGEIEIDDRLKEIDYGAWGGKSDAEIVEDWGEEALLAWRDRHIRPDGAGWTPSGSELQANALSVMQEAAAGEAPVLILTSNGILRYMHAALKGEPSGPDADAKVKTGRVCAARFESGEGERIFWNRLPEAALFQALSAPSD